MPKTCKGSGLQCTCLLYQGRYHQRGHLLLVLCSYARWWRATCLSKGMACLVVVINNALLHRCFGIHSTRCVHYSNFNTLLLASPSFPGAQDYSLLRGEGTSDVFPSDVESGKKRPASALRLLALAKEEALVHPIIAVHALLRCAPQLLAVQ